MGNKYHVEKLWIFGDSYSDPRSTLGQPSWVTAISERYTVENFSRRGTGPDWSLNCFYQQLELHRDQDLTSINLIFFISDPFRFNFSFYSSEEDQVLYWHIFRSSANSPAKVYKKYQTFLIDFFKYHVNSENFPHVETNKFIGSLLLHSHLFKKVLVWPLFFDIPLFIHTDNFTCVSKALCSFEKKESYNQDTKANHLSSYNHEVMLKQLCNWIDNNSVIDIGQFKTTV